jgi:transcriptional regulator with XRE-family HTH domain
MAMADPEIGTSLKAARERLGWSREALAYHSGISWSAIAQIESGRRANVRLSSLSALAGALNVTIDYLTGGAAAGPPQMLEHRVLVYRSTDEFLATVVPFLLEGVERSDAVLVVTTPKCVKSTRGSLGGDGKHVQFEDAAKWYSSPRETLRRYREFIDGCVEAGSKWVRIVGEPVWADRSTAEVREWTRYESIINLALASAPATIMCPYNATSVPASILRDASCTHPEHAEIDGPTPSESYREPEDYLLQVR